MYLTALYFFACVTEPGDLAVAIHRFSGTHNDGNNDDGDDNDGVVIIGDNDSGGDEESPGRKVCRVPTREQLADKQRSELFRRPRNHFATMGHHTEMRPMARLVVAGWRRVGGQRWSDDT